MSLLIQQPVAGANQYTGAVNAGLIDWNDLAAATRLAISATNTDETIVITTLALETEELIPTIFLRFAQPGGTALQRVTLARPRVYGTLTAEPTAGFSFVGCGFFVPRSNNGTIWNLVLTTTGKTLDANFIVEYTVGVKPGKIPNR